jgi:serine phosphatase RsbU (regulator of sigma subunit)
MSDGFPELFNHQKEILDYDKATDIFKSVADKSPDEIIKSLLNAVDEWKSGVNQEDDITFIVVKMR